MVILENIAIDIDIDKAILQNIDIDKISNRFKFGISNRAIHSSLDDLVLQWNCNSKVAAQSAQSSADTNVLEWLLCNKQRSNVVINEK